MGTSTYIPIDWDVNSPTYGKELAPVTTTTRPDGTITQEVTAPEPEGIGERIYPERIKQEDDFITKVLSSRDYQDNYQDMPDRAAQVEFSARVIRGMNPVDAAREIFEKRAEEVGVVRRKFENGVNPEGGLNISAPKESEYEKNLREQELQDMEINHRKKLIDILNEG
jgi:hypothetical protein